MEITTDIYDNVQVKGNADGEFCIYLQMEGAERDENGTVFEKNSLGEDRIRVVMLVEN